MYCQLRQLNSQNKGEEMSEESIAFSMNLQEKIQIEPNQTISMTLQNSSEVKIVLFGFAKGQELSEHTASVPATLHFLSGSAKVTLGDEVVETSAGTFCYMPAKLPHSISAKEDTKMLLFMLKKGK